MARVITILMSFALGTLALADRYSDCFQKIDNDRSIRGCTQIIESSEQEESGDLAKAYKTRGNIHFARGDYDRAIADFDMAIKLRPQDAEAYVKRGTAYASQDDYGRTIADFDKAIDLRPNRASIYTMRGHAYEKAGDKNQAIADYRKALQIDPTLQAVKQALKRLGARP
ncbi:MAG: tetratricopeptide repeat protein [Hyphomicrobium sp.]